ncbi:MAG TPA: Fic family protein [Ktedonobacteraceae bacterium]|nr:Fic family protein [Ktedonobacteraceae bacterium]
MNERAAMDARLARRLTEKKSQLDFYRPLDQGIVRRLHEDFRVEATYHSNAIEGNTLTLAETEMVLEYGMTIDGHPLREHYEVTNHAKAYDAMERLSRNPIDLETVLFLHRLVKAEIDEDAGQLRTGSVHIRGASFTPPPAREVPLYLAQWIRWLTSDQALAYEPVTRAAIAHHDFESLHPFFDGNGRVGRLLLNIMLIQDGYPPALVLRDWRQRYITALQHASTGSYQGIIDLIGQAVELSLDRYLQAYTDATTHLLPMKELAAIFETSVDYLGQLARTGKFDAKKRGSYWYASVETVAQYFHEANEQPRGRPRGKPSTQ